MLATGIVFLGLGLSLGFIADGKQLALVSAAAALAVTVLATAAGHGALRTALLLAVAMASLQLGYLAPLFAQAALLKCRRGIGARLEKGKGTLNGS